MLVNAAPEENDADDRKKMTKNHIFSEITPPHKIFFPLWLINVLPAVTSRFLLNNLRLECRRQLEDSSKKH